MAMMDSCWSKFVPRNHPNRSGSREAKATKTHTKN